MFDIFIDELIRLQHLENSSEEQLSNIIQYLKLHRILRTKGQALLFIQDRLPQRIIRSHQENNSNVFDIWRERERRARLDSKDSLEDEGQQIRDNTDNNQPTSTVTFATNTTGASKVKQMARNIDTKSTSSRKDEQMRSSSPSPTNLNQPSDSFYNETFIEDRFQPKRNASPVSSSEQRRVRQMIDRLESSSSPATNRKVTKQFSMKKSFHDEPADGAISFSSSPPFKRVSGRENQENNLTDRTFTYRHKSPHDEVVFRDNNSNITRFELNRDEIINGERRTASGTTVNYFSISSQSSRLLFIGR